VLALVQPLLDEEKPWGTSAMAQILTLPDDHALMERPWVRGGAVPFWTFLEAFFSRNNNKGSWTSSGKNVRIGPLTEVGQVNLTDHDSLRAATIGVEEVMKSLVIIEE